MHDVNEHDNDNFTVYNHLKCTSFGFGKQLVPG